MRKGRNTPKVDIIASANALLAKVRYDQDDTRSDQHCTVRVQSGLFDEKDAPSDNPLYGVIVYIEPKGSSEDYELFLKAAQGRLNLIYSCKCKYKGYKLQLSQNGQGLGISTSFNHDKNCLTQGRFLRLGK